MFGIGMPELLLILAVALIVLGPKKLPELARSLGRGLAELKKSTEELKGNLNVGDELKDVQKDLSNIIDPAQYLETLTPNPPVNQDVIPGVVPPMNQDVITGVNPPMDQGVIPEVVPPMNQDEIPGVNPEVNLGTNPEIKPVPETSSSSFPKASDV